MTTTETIHREVIESRTAGHREIMNTRWPVERQIVKTNITPGSCLPRRKSWYAVQTVCNGTTEGNPRFFQSLKEARAYFLG